MSDQQARDTIRQMLQDWNAATPEQRAEASAFAAKAADRVGSQVTKVAMIRDSRIPMGQPAPLVLRCYCGWLPPTDGKSESIVVCACGTQYTGNGWRVENDSNHE